MITASQKMCGSPSSALGKTWSDNYVAPLLAGVERSRLRGQTSIDAFRSYRWSIIVGVEPSDFQCDPIELARQMRQLIPARGAYSAGKSPPSVRLRQKNVPFNSIGPTIRSRAPLRPFAEMFGLRASGAVFRNCQERLGLFVAPALPVEVPPVAKRARWPSTSLALERQGTKVPIGDPRASGWRCP